MSEKHSKAGKARLTALTPEERKEVAREGAKARWLKADPARAKLPRAVYGADDRPIRIGNTEIPCFVLEDERRVLTFSGMQDALKMARGGSMVPGMNRFELFVSRDRVNPFISQELLNRIRNPIIFMSPNGGRSYGYEAEVLVEICEAVLEARSSEPGLQPQQAAIAHQCELLMRGLARVGIVALVDEATGFQEVRERDALHRILEAYISPELMPWQRRFPQSFYKEMFRLHGWNFDPDSVARPGVVGKFTNIYVYEQLPDGVLDELRKVNPKSEKGNRRAAHHQFLTDSVGHPHLERQIAATTAIMKVADDWPQFKRLFAKAHPKTIDGDAMEA